MQEQKKYQIEEVEHDVFTTSLNSDQNAFVLIKRRSGKLAQVNLFCQRNANTFFFPEAVGFWRIKQQKLNH